MGLAAWAEEHWSRPGLCGHRQRGANQRERQYKSILVFMFILFALPGLFRHPETLTVPGM